MTVNERDNDLDEGRLTFESSPRLLTMSMRLGLLSHVLAPALLVQLNLRLGISSSQLCQIDHIENAGCPVLVAGGDRDAHTTFLETQRLFQAAWEPKQLVIFEGAAHNDLLTYDHDKYCEIVAFLDAHLSINATENKLVQQATEQADEREPE